MLQLHFLDSLDGAWEKVRGFLREDLDYLQGAVNKRWNLVFDSSTTTEGGDDNPERLDIIRTEALPGALRTIIQNGVSVSMDEDFAMFNAARRNFGAAWRTASDAATGLQSIGLGTAGISDTGTNVEVVDSRGTWLRKTSAAAAGSTASLETTTPGLAAPNQAPFLALRLRLGADITNYRFWAGWFCQANTSSVNHTPPDTDTLIDNAANNNRVAIAFRFSTVAGDTGFRGVVSDGGGDGAPPPAAGIQTVTGNLGAAVASREYLFLIRVSADGNYATFTVQDMTTGIVYTETIPMPLTTMLANMATTTMSIAMMYVYTQAAAAKSVDFRGMHYAAGQTGV